MALGAAVGLLGCLELGARLARPDDPGAHCYEAPRNPTFRRGWASFTAPRGRPDGRPLILVLGNSQGFLREQDDGRLAYPSRLAAGLAARGVDAVVANWSVPAAHGPEFVVLAARAAQHKPDLVIVSAGTRAFGGPGVLSAPLSYWLSDVTDMIYDRGVRDRLPRSFLRRYPADPLAFLSAHSAFVRLRALLEPREGNSTWITSPQRQLSRRRIGLRPPDTVSTRQLLTELTAALRSEGEDTPLLLINMPICRPSWLAAAYRRTRVLSREAEALFADDPLTRVLDAREVVPVPHFTSATHLSPSGHQLYADWLLPQVLDALGDGDSVAPR